MKEKLPKQGHVQQVKWLPRDIRLGWTGEEKKGTLLYGWCTITDTLQLWEILETGAEAKAKFLGFISSVPS